MVVVQRDGGKAHLGAGVLDLPAVGDIDQGVVLLVVDPAYRYRLEEQAHSLREDFLALGAEGDLADRNRPGLGAGNGAVRRVLEPVPFGQPVEHAAVEMNDVAGDAGHLRVGKGLDHQPVAGPVIGKAADLTRPRPGGGEAQEDDQRYSRFHLSTPARLARRADPPGPAATIADSAAGALLIYGRARSNHRNRH